MGMVCGPVAWKTGASSTTCPGERGLCPPLISHGAERRTGRWEACWEALTSSGRLLPLGPFLYLAKGGSLFLAPFFFLPHQELGLAQRKEV